MVQAYDHRAAGVVIEKGNWMRQGQTEPTSLVFHQNPEFTVQPRWWVEVQRRRRDDRRQCQQALLPLLTRMSPARRISGR